MNKQEMIYFNTLSEERKNAAKYLDSFALSGVKESVVEKYSDQAHFIYELLQNADDAEASSARFELFRDKLIFAHNGTRRFSVSDPKSEKSDQEKGELGDINAICAVGGSSKTEGNSIGKFGIGFKSVFQYTSTPYIYDPNIFFKIENFIVPSLLNEDYSGRIKEETLFIFPFNHNKRSSQSSYEDIDEKLHSLVYPLLFLTNLKSISFKISDYEGKYEKNIEDTHFFENTTAELIKTTSNSLKNQGEEQFDSLWLFSREDENKRRYSVGYFVDKKGKLIPKTQSAFCFFPTKETTNLNFIIHAPFLLTDSRETIRAGEEYNKNLISKLAELAADSLVCLKKIGISRSKRIINDKILNIIPYDENKFTDINNKNSISFKPFYVAIKAAFQTKEIIPASNGYTISENAYWADTQEIAKLFSNNQLSDLVENNNAKWVFTSISKGDDEILNDYIESIIESETLDEEELLSLIDCYHNEENDTFFVEYQSIEWLNRFYEWIGKSKKRTDDIKSYNRRILLNKNGRADKLYKNNREPNIFLPTEDESEYNTVDERILKNEKTLEFLKELGIQEPSLKDEIYNIILPQYNGNCPQNNDLHFKKIFRYFRECPNKEEKSYINKIKEISFLLYKPDMSAEPSVAKAQEIYSSEDELLKSWFESKPDTKFLCFDEYLQLVGQDEEENLREFFIAIGVKNTPRILQRKLSWAEAHKIRKKWDHEDNDHYTYWYETYIDGCKEIIESIVENHSTEKSKLVWSWLLKLIETSVLKVVKKDDKLIYSNSLKISYQYFYRKEHSYGCWQESWDYKRLQNQPWLLNYDGEFVPANKLTVQILNPQYDTSSDSVLELFELLGIKEEEKPVTDLSTVAKQLGITDEEARQALSEYANRKNAENLNNKKENILNNSENSDDDENTSTYNKSINRVTKEISKRASVLRNEHSETHESVTDETYPDEDDYSKRINVERKIEKIKSNAEEEIKKVAQMEDLEQKASEFDTYSYGWFKTLLELESLISDENNYNSREISISFAKVERDAGTSRTLILRHPNRYIPQSMEELADIPLELHFASQPMVKAAIEVVNVKSYTLLAKLRTNVDIDGVDLSLVTEACIKAQNPIFLIKELKSAFEQLGKNKEYDDDFNMRDNLCDNIEFIFGPPGTGKTTYLAKNIIVPKMKSSEKNKVLVLTPTNKSADVLTQRIMEVMGNDCSYKHWLVRFGTTNDNVIEKSGVCRDKTFDIRKFQSNVTITTIARFSYDYFLPEDTLKGTVRLHLKELKWDYIIIDEASMIPLVNIIYPLYKKEPKKFIIAGDPFQIEPITKVSLWKDENIYSMVELHSFTSPSTIPHEYHVELLKTQYRSIPSVGEIFSRLSYGGILNHFRTPESQRELPIINGISGHPLNIIKFPVSKYESVYRPKRLQNRTPYQAYSALFSYEFIKYISSFLAENKKEKYRIGLITPYGAQADLIDKLMSSFDCPKNIDVQIGTIHGFQGDECDIVIALFNPPPSISNNENMFLNNLNIVNVAVSRAKDYLFVIMPDDDTENVDKLTLIKKVEQICKEQIDNWGEYHASDIELEMFGNEKYIEDNSFTTNHQLVNVYGKPEKRYEIRSEDNAVDVQIHNLN